MTKGPRLAGGRLTAPIKMEPADGRFRFLPALLRYPDDRGDAERMRFERTTRYIEAVAVVLGAATLRLALEPWLKGYSPFLFFVLAIVAVASWCGTRPAIVASGLAAIIGTAFTAETAFAPSGLISLATFVATAAGIILLARSMTGSRTNAETSDAREGASAVKASAAIEELNLLIDGAEGVALYMLDTDGDVTIWNRGAQRLKGWSEDEVMGRHCSLFYPADAIAEGKPQTDLIRARDEGRLDEEDWRVRKDGTEFLASVSITALRDQGDALRGYAKIVRDITDQRAAENALRASEDHFRSILSTVPDAMIVIDDRGTITSFSSAAEGMFGYRREDVVGRNVNCLMPSPDRERHDGYLERYASTGERRIIGIGRIVTGRRADGSTFPIELSVGEAITGGQTLFTGFIRDLTQKHAAEEQMRALETELIHISRISAMGTMASTLAHELNQPITSIANYVEGVRTLLEKPDAEDAEIIREALGDAVKEAMRAGDIVRRLRDFVSRGEIERSVQSLPNLVREAAVLGLMGAKEKGVHCHFDLAADASPVLVDKVQIQQVLINLVRNAVESMSGCPVRNLSIVSANDAPGMVRISIMDTGTGVSPEVAAALFKAFVTTKQEGMGLGLSICRTIIEAHGGKIWMEPRTAGGSAFHFTLVRASEEEGHGR